MANKTDGATTEPVQTAEQIAQAETEEQKRKRNTEKKPGYLTLERLAKDGFVAWASQSIQVLRYEGAEPVIETIPLLDLVHLTPANISTVANQYDESAKQNAKIRALAAQLRAMGLEEEAEKVLARIKTA